VEDLAAVSSNSMPLARLLVVQVINANRQPQNSVENQGTQNRQPQNH
jgi:hypothetical protein